MYSHSHENNPNTEPTVEDIRGHIKVSQLSRQTKIKENKAPSEHRVLPRPKSQAERRKTLPLPLPPPPPPKEPLEFLWRGERGQVLNPGRFAEKRTQITLGSETKAKSPITEMGRESGFVYKHTEDSLNQGP